MVWSISHPIVSTFMFVYKKNHENESIFKRKKVRDTIGFFLFLSKSLYCKNQDSSCVVLHHAPHNT